MPYWARFEAELAKRTALIAERHKDELHSLTARTKELEAAACVALQQREHEIEMPMSAMLLSASSSPGMRPSYGKLTA